MVSDTSQGVDVETFFQRVFAVEPRVAVFDCDGTLWSGDAGSSFMEWSLQAGLLGQNKRRWLEQRYEGYRRGDVSELAICGEMVQVYAGLQEAELRTAAAAFFREHVEAKIFPELKRLVAELTARSVQLWAVSSTNDWVIEEGVRRFGIPADRVLAARVAVEDGVVTDRILDVPTDEGKVKALERAGVPRPDVVFGNSVHDAAMLGRARQAFAVNPSAELESRAQAQGWVIYHP